MTGLPVKKTLVSFVVIAFGFFSFAQEAPGKVLSAGDLDAFIANFARFDAALARAGDKYDSYLDISVSETAAENPAAITAAITRLRSAVPPPELAGLMKKSGLGANGLEKYIVISYGFGALYFAKTMNEGFASTDLTPDLRVYVDENDRTFAAMRAAIHKDDLALIASRLDALIRLHESSGG
jgi:hypothetical protein